MVTFQTAAPYRIGYTQAANEMERAYAAFSKALTVPTLVPGEKNETAPVGSPSACVRGEKSTQFVVCRFHYSCDCLPPYQPSPSVASSSQVMVPNPVKVRATVSRPAYLLVSKSDVAQKSVQEEIYPADPRPHTSHHATVLTSCVYSSHSTDLCSLAGTLQRICDKADLTLEGDALRPVGLPHAGHTDISEPTLIALLGMHGRRTNPIDGFAIVAEACLSD